MQRKKLSHKFLLAPLDIIFTACERKRISFSHSSLKRKNFACEKKRRIPLSKFAAVFHEVSREYREIIAGESDGRTKATAGGGQR